MSKEQIISQLKSYANPKNVEGMARFGINPTNTLGVNIPTLRKIAKEIGNDHKLAKELWDTRIHEARILASFIDDHKLVTANQMDDWVNDFDSWDVCDQVCGNLFDKTPFALKKAVQWSKNKKEFVKRAGFVMMAAFAVHNKKLNDRDFSNFFPLIKRESVDGRNFVKKAVNWALRKIGKRNKRLSVKAIKVAKEIQRTDSKSARWIATDALRELRSTKFKSSTIGR